MHPLELFKFCPVCGSPHFEIHNEKSKNVRTAGLCIILTQVRLQWLLS